MNRLTWKTRIAMTGRIVWLLVLWGFSQEAFSTPVIPGHVEIIFEPNSESIDKLEENGDDVNKLFKKVCTSFIKNLAIRRGPWGFGVFKSYYCEMDEEKIKGRKRKANWRIVLKEEKDLVISVYKVIEDGGVDQKVAESVLKFSVLSYLAMQEKDFAALVAYRLLDSMPMALRVNRKQVKKDTLILKNWKPSISSSLYITPPKELVFYTLEFDPINRKWLADVKGRGVLIEEDLQVDSSEEEGNEENSNEAEENVESNEEENGVYIDEELEAEKEAKRKTNIDNTKLPDKIRYKLDASVVESLKSEHLWAKNFSGRGSRIEELDSESINFFKAWQETKEGLGGYILRSADFVKDLFKSSASAGFVGMRYGLQVLTGDPLLEQTSLFGLVTEVRGGPLKGLRYYYETVPMTKVNYQNQSLAMGWSRHFLGTSIGFDLDLFIIDRIDVVPKIGLWSFDARLPIILEDESIDVFAFKIDNEPSFILELGIEKTLFQYLLFRGWYARDTAIQLGDKGGSVASNRLGMDASWTGGPKFTLFSIPFRTAFLGFITYDMVTLEDPSVKDGEDAITKINFSSSYLGGGIGLSW